MPHAVCLAIFASALLGGACAAAAAPLPEWLETSWEFGTIAETAGPAQGHVRMVNTTGAPLTIERVKTTCGCTSASWPESPVQPGDTATISFAYNPAGRPGHIDKRLKVYFEGLEAPREIRLTGLVIPSEETLAYSYPVDCGELRLATDMLDAGTIHPGVARHLFVYLYNRGTAPIIPSGRSDDTAVKVTVTPDTLLPGDSGTLVIQWLIPSGATEGEAASAVTVTARDGSGAPLDHPALPHKIALRGDIRRTDPT